MQWIYYIFCKNYDTKQSKHIIPTVTCINAINEVFVELQTPNGLLIKSLEA